MCKGNIFFLIDLNIIYKYISFFDSILLMFNAHVAYLCNIRNNYAISNIRLQNLWFLAISQEVPDLGSRSASSYLEIWHFFNRELADYGFREQ